MIPLFKVYMSPDAVQAASKVLSSGYIGEGEVVKNYESALKKFFNTDHGTDIITTNSATSAEHMIYHMLKSDRKLTWYHPWGSASIDWIGMKPGDEVITTALTCTATNWPIIHNGFKIVWADIDPATMNISIDSIIENLTERTRVIQVVHWGGYPVDMDKINEIQKYAFKEYGNRIMVIEDCAHAFGSLYKGTPVGFNGDFATFSTQAIKHLTTVDGGFMVSPYIEFNRAARLVRWYGIDRDQPRTDFRCEQDIPEIGFKFHMNDVNASIGLANLEHIDKILSAHRDHAFKYNTNLKNIPGVVLLENNPDFKSSYWLYTIRVKDRDGFMKKMHEKGIQVSRVHERNDKHSAVKEFSTHLPNLDMVSKDMICIPVGWWVTDEQIEYIIQSIKQGW